MQRPDLMKRSGFKTLSQIPPRTLLLRLTVVGRQKGPTPGTPSSPGWWLQLLSGYSEKLISIGCPPILKCTGKGT